MALSIVHIITSLEVGGAQKILYDLLAQTSHCTQHTLFFIHDGPYKKRFESIGISCISLSGLFFSYDILSIFKLLYALFRVRPDVIHTHLWAATIIGRFGAFLFRVPCITSYHNHLALYTPFRRFLDRCTVKMSQENIAVSPAICTELRTVYYTLPSEKIILIANGIAVPEMVQKKADDAPFTIGFVGRFITEKNVDLLIMHFAQLYTEYPKARLIIVGSGSQERILKNLVTVLGLSHVIRFVGTSPDSWYPQFDCFVQISQTEGLSLALLEAMSYQVVPIVSVECNTNMLIQDGFNGVVVEKKELIHGFSRVLDRSFSKECGARARDMVLQNYSIDRLVRDYQKCWIRQLHKSEKRAL